MLDYLSSIIRGKKNVIYLIGCDHDAAQTYIEGSRPDRTHEEFRKLLFKTIRNHEPELIIEELHPDSLKARNRQSIAFQVALEMRTSHRFCDPYGEERRLLEISDGPPCIPPDPSYDSFRNKAMFKYFRHEWPIREEFWIGKLGEDIHRSILFICGAGHRETLRRRLERRAVEVKVIEKRFGAVDIWKGDFPAHKAAYKDLRRNGFLPPKGIGSLSSIPEHCATEFPNLE
jgi:hypothetical protein